jgi:hypothetical protein
LVNTTTYNLLGWILEVMGLVPVAAKVFSTKVKVRITLVTCRRVAVLVLAPWAVQKQIELFFFYQGQGQQNGFRLFESLLPLAFLLRLTQQNLPMQTDLKTQTKKTLFKEYFV